MRSASVPVTPVIVRTAVYAPPVPAAGMHRKAVEVLQDAVEQAVVPSIALP